MPSQLVFKSYVPKVLVAMGAAQAKAILAACDVGRNETTENLRHGPRSGRTYKHPETGLPYTASAPGEYPQYVTGDLFRSINRKVVKGDGYIGSNMQHGYKLHTRKGTGRREWLKDSLEEARPKMLKELMKRWF